MAFEGKVIGYTNSAGKLAGWATDVTVGTGGYYALLFGMDRTAGLPKDHFPKGLPSPDQLLMEQFVALGALHLGAQAVGKISGQVFDNALLKLTQRSTSG